MATTIADIERMIANEEPEGQYLDYKDGASLMNTDKKKKDLVKDVTGLANAGGGRIIYGVCEKKGGKTGVPGDFSPVTNTETTRDWIYSVLQSRSSPPYSDFEIEELEAPGGGRVVVLTVQPGSTALQNMDDYRYYQRAGSQTTPMLDFQIRDVMNRRSKPELSVHVGTSKDPFDPKHPFQVVVEIKNVGIITLENWRLEIVVPSNSLSWKIPASADSDQPYFHDYVEVRLLYPIWGVSVICLSDPLPSGRRMTLHPHQTARFPSLKPDVPAFYLTVDAEQFEALQRQNFAITWQLFMPNTAPLSGSLPFTEWCVDPGVYKSLI